MRRSVALGLMIATLALWGCRAPVPMVATPTPIPAPATPTLPPPTFTPTSPPPTPTPTLPPTPTPLPPTATPIPPSPTPTPPSAGPLIVDGQRAQRLMGGPWLGDAFYAYPPAGLYRTLDGGASWQLVAPQPAVRSFVFSPADPNVLYSGKGYPCYKGGPHVPFFKSVDGGASWFELEAGTDLKPVAVHPQDPNRVYAIGCDGPYLTADGGQTWQLQSAEIFRIYNVLQIVPAPSDWEVVYLGGASEGGAGAVVKSADGGRTWEPITGELPELWWISALAVDSADPDRVYFADPHGFWRSEDGGATWRGSTAGLEDVVYREGFPFDGLRTIVVDPKVADRLYLGTVKGVYVSTNGGESWEKIEGQEWEDEEILDLAVRAGEPTLLYVTTAEGVFVLPIL